MKYWLYQTHVQFWRQAYVQAELMQPNLEELRTIYGPYGYHGPLQDEPYGAQIEFTYRVNPKHPYPDNYFENTGFSLFSVRLIELMRAFDVRAEYFPVKVIDLEGNRLSDAEYYVFHSLEGVQDAMDHTRSGWTGDYDTGVARLILDESKFEARPIFVCKHVYVSLMRDDLRQEIRRQSITGFAFLEPELYRSGAQGFAPDFHK